MPVSGNFYIILIKLFCGFSYASESESETYELLIEYSAQFDSILHMLHELFRDYRTGCVRLCSLIVFFPASEL